MKNFRSYQTYKHQSCGQQQDFSGIWNRPDLFMGLDDEKGWAKVSNPYSIRIFIRRLMGWTDQADPSCFYFRISWILMERLWFYLFCPLHLLQGLRSLKNWLLQKIKYKHFGPKILILLWKWIFWCHNISRNWIFWTLKVQF